MIIFGGVRKDEMDANGSSKLIIDLIDTVDSDRLNDTTSRL